MNLTQLRYLAAIADAGLNITAAARRVHATQPGISKQIRQLEDELRFQIFSRKGKSLSGITAAGAQVIERARIVVGEIGNIQVLAANLRQVADGELRIATTHTQARYALPQPVSRFNHSHPAVSVHLMPGGDAEVRGLLDAGDVDFAILSAVDAPPPDYCAVPLYRWKRIAVTLHDHPLASERQVDSLEALAAYPLVSYESVQRPDSSLRRAFGHAGLRPRIACTARDADLIKTYVRAGLGVGVLAEMAWLPEDAADLRMVAIDGLLPECISWLLVRNDRLLRDYALAFIRALAPHVDRHDLRRAFEGGESVEWPEPPGWRELRQRHQQEHQQVRSALK
ncbi:MAG TPA: LysR substrate-binding domain-containing protein [Gammaproteobacteria bacterium]|nr:LysR substrate-binding domain-containing protein [Gammaproteobacteria bacterium]